jgi:polar amino acid transport system substrate-binding protein
MQGRVFACLLLGVALVSSAVADSWRLVTGDDYAPFTGESLPAGGMLTQVVQSALAAAGISNTLDWRPWNRGYLQTLRGDYDATFPYVRSVQREQEYLYSEPLFTPQQHIFSRAGEVIEVTDIASMLGKRLCFPLGWQSPPVLQQMLDRGQLVRHSPAGLKECAKLLLLGRDDFFISDHRLGLTALQASGAPMSAFRRSTETLSSSALHLIVPRSHPRAAAIIEQFNEALAALHASGEYQRLIEDYLQQLDKH